MKKTELNQVSITYNLNGKSHNFIVSIGEKLDILTNKLLTTFDDLLRDIVALQTFNGQYKDLDKGEKAVVWALIEGVKQDEEDGE